MKFNSDEVIMNITLKRKKVDKLSLLLRVLVIAAALITAGVVIFVVGYILVMGIPNLKPSLFELEYTTENVSLVPALINTLAITGLSLLIAVPTGVLGAVYLVEYTKRGGRFVKVIRSMAETLSGIPSIVYGLFGLLMFVQFLGLRLSLLSGALTLSVMILPLVLRTTEEALMAVPDSYREGSFAVGAGKLRTVFVVVLPTAAPGILAGVILGVGRIVGETAALLYTAGSVAQIAPSVMDAGRTLAIHMYALSSEGLYTEEAYATAVVLLAVTFLINALSSFLAKRLTSGRTVVK